MPEPRYFLLWINLAFVLFAYNDGAYLATTDHRGKIYPRYPLGVVAPLRGALSVLSSESCVVAQVLNADVALFSVPLLPLHSHLQAPTMVFPLSEERLSFLLVVVQVRMVLSLVYGVAILLLLVLYERVATNARMNDFFVSSSLSRATMRYAHGVLLQCRLHRDTALAMFQQLEEP